MKYGYPAYHYDIRKLPRWKKWLIYGWLQFYIIIQIYVSYGQLEAFYSYSSPDVRIPFVTLSMYTQLKNNLLKFGIDEKSQLIQMVDGVGERAYQRGINILPKEDGEQYIWYYWRYLESYPPQYVARKNKQIESLMPQFLVALNGLSSMPINNVGLDHKLKYNVLAHMLSDYIDYLHMNYEDLQRHKSHIEKFISLYHSNAKNLLQNFALPDDAVRYVMFGNILNAMYIVKSSDIACDDIALKNYKFYTDKKDQIAQKSSFTIRSKIEALSQSKVTKDVNKIINNKVDQLCKDGEK